MTRFFSVSLVGVFTDSYTAYDQVSRWSDHIVQDCEPAAILPGDDEEDDWRGRVAFENSSGVSSLSFSLAVSIQFGNADLNAFARPRIHDVSYKAFFDTLDAKGRSLLRFLHVRPSFSLPLPSQMPSTQVHLPRLELTLPSSILSLSPSSSSSSQPPDSDLSPPLALRDSAQTLREIMTVYEATLIGVADDPRVEGDFSRILDAAVDPPLEMCRRMADLRKGEGGEWEKAVFLANCVGYLEVSCLDLLALGRGRKEARRDEERDDASSRGLVLVVLECFSLTFLLLPSSIYLARFGILHLHS